MEKVYGWPVNHEEGYPDLCGGEEVLGKIFDEFNLHHKASRAVLVNQWDWNPRFCGERMPSDMTFADIRRGTDLEFGMSIYEPFGISQFEPLSFGAICVVSNVCGCMGYARKAIGPGADKGTGRGKKYDNIIEANFLAVPPDMTIDAMMNLPIAQRDDIETAECSRLAKLVVPRLPRTQEQMQRLIDDGCELAGRMSWEHVVNDYFLPSLSRVASPQ
jgi:hypothetical protein